MHLIKKNIANHKKKRTQPMIAFFSFYDLQNVQQVSFFMCVYIYIYKTDVCRCINKCYKFFNIFY